ncbi:MAG: prepilin-type N-terminal cleavage/methylation domain-containing protein [Nitrospirota bacterium]
MNLKDTKGFTLIELIMIIVVLSIAIPPLLLYFIQGVRDSSDAQLLTQSIFLAQDIIEEAKSKKWDENSPVPPGNYSTSLGSDGETRITYDDMDDYNNLNITPPQDSQGNPISGFNNFTQAATVCYVANTDLNTCIGGQSNYKKISVTVSAAGTNGPQAEIVTVMANY